MHGPGCACLVPENGSLLDGILALSGIGNVGFHDLPEEWSDGREERLNT